MTTQGYRRKFPRSMQQLPPEVWDHICWMIDNVKDLKAMRLVSRGFAQSSLAPVFHTIRLYPNTHSFDKLDAILSRRDLVKAVKVLEYSADMFRFYPQWVDDFGTWKAEVASGQYLRYRESGKWKPSEAFSPEQLYACHAHWKKMVEGQGWIIGRSQNWDYGNDDIQERRFDEVARLTACLQQLTNLKSVHWTCDYWRCTSKLRHRQQNLTEAPIFADLPKHEQMTLVPQDSIGSKYRHAKQVTNLLRAIHEAKNSQTGPGRVTKLILSELNSSHVSDVFLQDSPWIKSVLSDVRDLHLRVGVGSYNLPQWDDESHVNRCRDSIARCLLSSSRLEKLTIFTPTLHWKMAIVGVVPSTLRELSLQGCWCTEAEWAQLLINLENLEKLNISTGGIIRESIQVRGRTIQEHPWYHLVVLFLSMTRMKHIRVRGSLFLKYKLERRSSIDLGSHENDDEGSEEDEIGDSAYDPSAGYEAGEEDIDNVSQSAAIIRHSTNYPITVELDEPAARGITGMEEVLDFDGDIGCNDDAKRRILANSLKRSGWSVRYFSFASLGHNEGEILLEKGNPWVAEKREVVNTYNHCSAVQ